MMIISWKNMLELRYIVVHHIWSVLVLRKSTIEYAQRINQN